MLDGANIKPLTSLRFFAAFWVVLFHYWHNLAGVTGTPSVVEKGYLGVELFFTLSGFILCHVYLTGLGEGRFRYGSFLWARLARVYPLHIATLLGVGVMALVALAAGMSVDGNILSWASLPANLLMIHAWGFAPQAGWNHPSWSISAEWFAYLMFPAFGWLAWRLRNRPYMAMAGSVAFLAALYVVFERLAGFPLTRATIAWGALRIVPCFTLGCATYLVWRRSGATGAAERRDQAAIGAVFFGAGILLAAQFGAPDALIVPGFAGLILSLAKLARAGSSFGTQAAFVYLGEISYSVYMICIPWQLVFVNVATKVMHLSDKKLPLFAWLVFVVTVVPLAAASYHLIEKPARERMKLIAQRRVTHAIATATAR
ncbi:acyltransferase family protein [Caulobacter sp. KR2-114]|uniref:acyltransferase family protein n=1 Tax=Caulobacter sp. KR2-114 TaxID=3400912 RepID=UPI003C0E7084